MKWLIMISVVVLVVSPIAVFIAYDIIAYLRKKRVLASYDEQFKPRRVVTKYKVGLARKESENQPR